MAKTVPKSLPLQYRTFTIDPTQFENRAEGEEDNRTIELSFSSETSEVERWFGVEILDHKKNSVRMQRLNDGAPLLLGHNPDKQIGVIEGASIKDKRGIATVRFSESKLGEEIYRDVKAKIRRNVSVGYRVHEMQREKVKGINGDRDVYRVGDWEPYEVSIVAVGADNSVGIGRSAEAEEFPVKVDAENERMAEDITNPPAPPVAPKVDVVKERGEAVTSERKRIAEIMEVSDFVRTKQGKDVSEAATQHIRDGKPVDEFRKYVLENAYNAKAVELRDPGIGMEARDVSKFSILRAIKGLVETGKPQGFEGEVCEAARKQIGRAPVDERSFIIPDEVSRAGVGGLSTRAQNAGTTTAGGALIQEQYGSLIEFLRNRTALGRMGITILDGLVGNLVIPQQTSGATSYWVSETGAITDSEAAFAMKTMSPHRLGAAIPYTTQLLAQTSIGVEAWVRNEIDTSLALLRDLAGLHGTGVAGQPLGVANSAGINATVTYGGAATWADVVEHETGIAVDNADIGTMGFLLSAATVGKWKTILRDSVAGAGYLLDNGMTANGYKVERTNQISGNVSFFGVWSQLLLGLWAGREVTIDNITLAKSGQHQIIVNEFCDYLVRQPLAFNVSTDSAAQ